MVKTKLLLKKCVKKPLTIRLDPAVRKEAEKLAESNKTTLTNVVESGLALLFEKIKNEQKDG
jgi:predicted transcriptional regulator